MKTSEKNSYRMIVLALTSFCLTLTHAIAQEEFAVVEQVLVVSRETITNVPPATDIDPLVLTDSVRGAIAVAVDNLLQRADTNYMTFAIPPRTTRRVIGYDEITQHQVTTRYREEMVQVPIYKNIVESEEYETFAISGGSSTEARSMGKVKRTRTRIVGREKIGSREEKRLIRDPEGPITKVTTHTRQGKPIYADGQDVFQAGVMGANALIYVTLRKSGIPENNPVLEDMFKEFVRLIDGHSIPDYTWDVAWLAAAFCNQSNKRYDEHREWLLAKLLDGQIKEGPGRGFWGPVCIDTTLIPQMLTYEQKLNADRTAARERLKERRDDPKRQEALDAIELALEKYIESYRYITRQGLRFNDPISRYNATARPGIIMPISVTGLPYYYFNQALADMDSTFYAMYAIREAFENGYLPTATKRVMTTDNRPVAPPETPNAVLARMANALAARQHPSGQWDECNTHQPISAFTAQGLPQLLADDLLSLESPLSHLATVQGFSCLLNAGRIVGLERLFSRFGDQATKGQIARREAVGLFLAGQPAGRAFEPYDFYFAIKGIQRNLGGDEEQHRDLWSRLAYRLVFMQNPDGTWGTGAQNTTIHSSSLYQFGYQRAKNAHDRQQAKLPPQDRKEFDGGGWRRRFNWHHYEFLPVIPINTAMATLFLIDGVRMPVAGYVKRNVDPSLPPPVMGKVIELLQTRDKVNVNHMVIDPANPSPYLNFLPVVFVSSDTDFNNAALIRLLRQYCDHGGTVVAEIGTSAEAMALQPRLLSLVEGGRQMVVPETAPVFANFMGAKPRMNAIANDRGRPVVYIIPLDAIPASPAVQTAYLLVKDNVQQGFFDADYPSKLGGQEGLAMRIRSLPILKGAIQATVVPVEPAAPGASPEAAGTDSTPAAGSAPAAPIVPSGPMSDEVW